MKYLQLLIQVINKFINKLLNKPRDINKTDRLGNYYYPYHMRKNILYNDTIILIVFTFPEEYDYNIYHYKHYNTKYYIHEILKASINYTSYLMSDMRKNTGIELITHKNTTKISGVNIYIRMSSKDNIDTYIEKVYEIYEQDKKSYKFDDEYPIETMRIYKLN